MANNVFQSLVEGVDGGVHNVVDWGIAGWGIGPNGIG
jgi:hypothetical protein